MKHTLPTHFQMCIWTGACSPLLERLATRTRMEITRKPNLPILSPPPTLSLSFPGPHPSLSWLFPWRGSRSCRLLGKLFQMRRRNRWVETVFFSSPLKLCGKILGLQMFSFHDFCSKNLYYNWHNFSLFSLQKKIDASRLLLLPRPPSCRLLDKLIQRRRNRWVNYLNHFLSSFKIWKWGSQEFCFCLFSSAVFTAHLNG